MKEIINDLKEIHIDGLCTGLNLAIEYFENNENLNMFKVVFKNGLDVIVECESVELIYKVDGTMAVNVIGSKKAIEFFNAEEILYIQEI